MGMMLDKGYYGGGYMTGTPYYQELWWQISGFIPVVVIAFLILLFLILLSMKKDPSTFWKNFGHNLKVSYLYLALFVSLMVILFSGITLIKTALETKVFVVEYDYVDYYVCQSQYDPETQQYVPMEGEELDNCKADQLATAKENRKTTVNKDLSWGTAALIVGLLVWITHFLWVRKGN